MTDEITREYEHLVTGERVGAYVGTARDDAFQSDVHWKLISGPDVTGPRTVDPADPRAPKGNRHVARNLATPDGTPEADEDGETDIEKLSRDELNELAESLGIDDPAALGNKQEVKDAIAKAQQSEPDGTPEADEDGE
jgi:hypothetical protein